MSYARNRSDISEEDANRIATMLCFNPESTYNKYEQESDPIVFYRKHGDVVHLPYLFAASLFQITPNVNLSYMETNLAFTGTLRPAQVPVEQEAWGQLEKYGTSTLGLHPGFGKTILGASLGSRAKLLLCVLVHREILTIQWKKTFEDNTNAQVWIVGEPNPPPTCNVIICMDSRWDQIAPEVRDAVGFLIIDEAHTFCTRGRVDCMLSFHPKYILLESASLERDDGLHTMMYALAGTHGVYRESHKPFNIMKINTNFKPIRKKNKMGGTDWTALVRDTAFDERRNQIIINLIMSNLQFKVLVMTQLREHTMLLYNVLKRAGVSCDYLCGTKKGYVDPNVLIVTSEKAGTGFDPATACPTHSGRHFDLLIMARSMKKYSMLVQNFGRVFRADFPTIMYLVDNDNIFKSHWYKVRKWCLTRGGILTEHNIPNNEQPPPQDITTQQQRWTAAKTKQLKLNVIQ